MPVTPVLHPRSAVENKKPAAAGLQYGQIAVGYNAAAPLLWIKNTDNQVVAINPLATEGLAGLSKRATQAQVLDGTNATAYVSPRTLAEKLASLDLGEGGCGNCPPLDGGNANGDVVIDGGSALQFIFSWILDGGFA